MVMFEVMQEYLQAVQSLHLGIQAKLHQFADEAHYFYLKGNYIKGFQIYLGMFHT